MFDRASVQDEASVLLGNKEEETVVETRRRVVATTQLGQNCLQKRCRQVRGGTPSSKKDTVGARGGVVEPLDGFSDRFKGGVKGRIVVDGLVVGVEKTGALMFGRRARTSVSHVGPEIARDAGFVFEDKGGDIKKKFWVNFNAGTPCALFFDFFDCCSKGALMEPLRA